MKIRVEKRVNKEGDKQNLRLVFWHGSHTDASGKVKPKRTLEQLDQYLFADPKTKPEKQLNKETLQLVEAIKAKRLTEAATDQHGFTDTIKIKSSYPGAAKKDNLRACVQLFTREFGEIPRRII